MWHNYRSFIGIPIVQSATCSAFWLGLFCSPFGFSQDAAPRTPTNTATANEPSVESDLAALRAKSQAFVAAFNRRDAQAISALWTENGEYIDDFGRQIAGRDAIEKEYASFFTDNASAKIRIVIDSLRLLSDDAAIEDGFAVVEPPPDGAPGISKYTAVHVKVDGNWMMASVRDTWAETPSAYQNIADLEWLIGTWIAEEHGAKNESACSWVANKSFVERKYTITRVDGTTASGVQLIGWNPEGNHVQSWDFSQDGGHAVGTWSPLQDGWSAEMQGVTGDGTRITSVNMLSRLDDNAYVWQSVQRTAGGMALADTDEVVLKRQPATR